MKKDYIVKIISFLSALVIVVTGFLIKANIRADRYKLHIENTYSRSLNEFEASVNNISMLLKKAEFSTSPKEISRLAAKLLSEAEIAKTALSQLPKNTGELTVINRFLSQVGNYAMSISKTLVEDEKAMENFDKNIPLLINAADKIAKAINESNITYNNSKYWASQLENSLQDLDNSDLGTAFSDLEESLSDYPTLIYDGPYSDHIQKKEPQMLINAKDVTVETALKTASDFTGANEDALTHSGDVDGKIECYRFTGEDLSITVSKKGGYPVAMRKTREIGTNNLKYSEALEKAKKFLQETGMTGFTETYYFTDEGVCVINFAFLDGQTLCYTDLVKVGVAMDTGEIMLYEANGYLSNHTERAFATPAVTEETAMNKVSNKLKIKTSQLALIPTDSLGEVRCYEFHCQTSDEQEVLVYINATTGEEESILILLKNDGGTLVK